MGGGHNCKLARSGAAQRLKLTVRQLASKMATGGCVARSPVLHRAGQKVAYSVSGYLVSCSNRVQKVVLGTVEGQLQQQQQQLQLLQQQQAQQADSIQKLAHELKEQGQLLNQIVSKVGVKE